MECTTCLHYVITFIGCTSLYLNVNGFHGCADVMLVVLIADSCNYWVSHCNGTTCYVRAKNAAQFINNI